jgi:putative endonuclease
MIKNHDAYDKGVIGEEKALSCLLNKGYALVKTRYRFKGGEIDLIMTKDQTLVMVEVRVRKNIYLAAESVTPLKRQRLTITAEHFIMHHPTMLDSFPFVRFDVVLINKEGELNHIENAFGV